MKRKIKPSAGLIFRFVERPLLDMYTIYPILLPFAQF